MSCIPVAVDELLAVDDALDVVLVLGIAPVGDREEDVVPVVADI